MDFSKLGSNDKLAVYGAVAAIAGAILSQIGSIYGAGGLWFSTILALAMIAVIFLPQWSPTTTLPGSKGSLMLIIGGLAALGGVFGLIGGLSLLGLGGGLYAVGILVGAAGSLLMGWASWKEFQAEGGKFNVGMASSAPPAPPAPPAAPPAPPAPPAPTMSEPTAPVTGEPISPPTSEPMDEPMGGERRSDEEPPA